VVVAKNITFNRATGAASTVIGGAKDFVTAYALAPLPCVAFTCTLARLKDSPSLGAHQSDNKQSVNDRVGLLWRQFLNPCCL
jgi:hypothetical protein